MPASPAPAPWRLASRSEAETLALARAFGRRARPGHVFALAGPLGAGKTVFARGLAEGLGVEEPVVSPTFTLMHRYQGRHPVLHVDAYRLEDPGELRLLGLDDLLAEPLVAVVEWADRAAALLPGDVLWVTLAPGPEPGLRVIELRAAGPEHARLLADVREEWPA